MSAGPRCSRTSRSTNCCPTVAVETKQEELPHLAKIFLTTTIAPLPIESVTNSHNAAAQTNGRNYQLVGHGKVSGLGADLLVNTPERRASCAWDRNPDVHNHIICFANPQQMVQRAPRTHQPKDFKRRDSDCHRVLNHRGSQLGIRGTAQLQEHMSMDATRNWCSSLLCESLNAGIAAASTLSQENSNTR